MQLFLVIITLKIEGATDPSIFREAGILWKLEEAMVQIFLGSNVVYPADTLTLAQ